MTWLKDWLTKVLVTKGLGSALTKAVTILATLLTSSGVATLRQSDDWKAATLEIVPGLLAYFISWAMSWLKREALIKIDPKTAQP